METIYTRIRFLWRSRPFWQVAGILAAIMSSLDSQFLCMGTIFTNDIVLHLAGRDRFSDRQVIWIARGFVIIIVALTYLLSLTSPQNVFDLAIWCFSGFGALFPVVFCAIFWKRTTKAGAVCGMIAGFLTTVVWVLMFKEQFYDLYEMIPGFGAGFLVTIAVSLATEPPPGAAAELDAVRSVVGGPFSPAVSRSVDDHLIFEVKEK